jgi:endonuclease-3
VTESALDTAVDLLALEPAARVQIVSERLRAHYGRRSARPSGDPLAELIQTILSQNTSDRNADRAFARLQAAFPDLRQLLEAPVAAIRTAIQPAGLANIKAPRIQAVLAEIQARRGNLDLAFLAEWPVEEAMAWLESLPGIGPKTAACVLLFALGRPAFPVDTHIHRVSRRLGLVEARLNAVQTQRVLTPLVPPGEHFQLHVDLITLGRQVCHARSPRHAACVLRAICPAARRVLSLDRSPPAEEPGA